MAGRPRAKIQSESEDSDGETSTILMEVSSESETNKSSHKRKLRKRGKEHVEDELDIRREDRKKKKIKRKTKSKSKSPDAEIMGESTVDEEGENKKKKIGREGLRSRKIKEEKTEETHSKTENELHTEEDMEELNEALAGVVGVNMASMPSHSLDATAMEWINEVEDGRKRSRNIQGAISGMMKRNLEQARDAIATLMMRAEEKGDQWYLRSENKEKHAQILALRKEVADLRELVEELRKQLMEKPPPIRGKMDVLKDVDLEDGNFPNAP